MKESKLHIKKILHELKNHIPFTAAASFAAVILIFVITKVYNISAVDIRDFFEVLHPVHVIFSATVTSAIFHKYKKNLIQSLLVGISGAIILGSLSDILLPYLGGLIFSFNMLFHLPILESPVLILGAALIGSLIGIFSGLTKLPHFFHVLLSVVVSIFYLSAFAFTSINAILAVLAVTIIVFISVIIPCCVSDILYPFLFIGKK